MRRPVLAVVLGVCSAFACGSHGAPQYSGAPPSAEETYGSCAFCHNALAVNMTATGGHGSLSLKCESCHQDLKPGEAGPGHRSVPACAECHSTQMTHQDPAAGTKAACVVCHTPHGSANLTLIQPLVLVCIGGNKTGGPCLADSDCPGGSCSGEKPIQLCAGGARNVEPCFTDGDCPGGTCSPGFTNFLGKADFSFATATHPGNGLCEVCHTTTRFYRSDGSGAEHFPFTCFTCHPHSVGFRPR